jgi:NADH pyrophosphatase NudC (nudix superfamily)
MMEGERVFKTVFYFVAEVGGAVELQKKEIHDGKWLSISDALHQLTHPEGRSILLQVEKILTKS